MENNPDTVTTVMATYFIFDSLLTTITLIVDGIYVDKLLIFGMALAVKTNYVILDLLNLI